MSEWAEVERDTYIRAGSSEGNSKHKRNGRWGSSVAMVTTNIFQINWFSMRNKIGKISKIFVKTEDPENRGVI